MKKIFAIILALCLMTSVLCVSVAAENCDDWGKINTEFKFDSDTERTDGRILLADISGTRASGLRFGSMIGNGSLAMVVSLASLATSIMSIVLVVDMKKKLDSKTDAESDEENE